MGTKHISGTPTTAGTYHFTLKAQNSAGNDTQAYTVVINSPVITYRWKKYNIETSTTTEYTESGWHYSYHDTASSMQNLYADYTFSISSGFELIGEAWIEEYATGDYGYDGGSTSISKYVAKGSGQGFDVYVNQATPHTSTEESRGSYVGIVTSQDSGAYPNNGTQGGYWYVYDGTV